MKSLTAWWSAEASLAEDTGKRPTGHWLQNARPWLGALIGIALLAFVLRDVDFQNLQMALRQADYRYLLGAVVPVLAGTVLRAVRWRLLLLPHHSPQIRNVIASVLAGQLVNLVVPFKVGELVRVYYVSETTRMSKVFALSTVAVERSVDALLVLALAAALVPLVAFPEWFRWSGVTSAAGFGTLLVVMILMARHRKGLTSLAGRVLRRVPALESMGFVQRLSPAAGALDALARPKLVLGVWVLSGLIWLCGALVNHIVILALGLDLPFTVSLFVLLTMAVGVAVPSLPWQFGLFQSIAVLSLMAFGVDQTTGLAYGLLLHLVAYGPPTFLGAISLRYLESARRRVGVKGIPVGAEEGS